MNLFNKDNFSYFELFYYTPLSIKTPGRLTIAFISYRIV
jgi:hypothetical protein